MASGAAVVVLRGFSFKNREATNAIRITGTAIKNMSLKDRTKAWRISCETEGGKL